MADSIIHVRMANSIVRFLLFRLLLSLVESDLDLFALANSGFAFERTTVFRCGIATEGITVFRSTMLPLIARALANCGFTFEGIAIFRCGIAIEGITVFRSRMLPLIARRRGVTVWS